MRTDNPCDSPYVLMSRIHPCLPVHPLWIRHRLQVSLFSKTKDITEIKGAPPPKFNYSLMIIKGCRQKKKRRKKEVHQVVRPVKHRSDVQGIRETQHWEHKLLKCLSGVETALKEWRNCITCNNVYLPVGFWNRSVFKNRNVLQIQWTVQIVKFVRIQSRSISRSPQNTTL